MIDCRTWSDKPYRSKQRKLCEGKVKYVELIHILKGGLNISRLVGAPMWKADVADDRRAMNEFAKADGFSEWSEMEEWFEKEHGLPFEGILILWGPMDAG